MKEDFGDENFRESNTSDSRDELYDEEEMPTIVGQTPEPLPPPSLVCFCLFFFSTNKSSPLPYLPISYQFSRVSAFEVVAEEDTSLDPSFFDPTTPSLPSLKRPPTYSDVTTAQCIVNHFWQPYFMLGSAFQGPHDEYNTHLIFNSFSTLHCVIF